MSTITFDTLDKQAVAQSDSLSQAFDVSVATKGDLAAVKADIVKLDNKVDALRVEMQSRFEAMEMRLTIKLGAFLAVAVGVMLTVLKMH